MSTAPPTGSGRLGEGSSTHEQPLHHCRRALSPHGRSHGRVQRRGTTADTPERVTETVTETATEKVTEVITERPTSQLNRLRRKLDRRNRTIARLRARIRSLEDQVAVAPEPQPEPASDCHPSYEPCVPADVEDVDCVGGSGNGPEYTGRVTVIGPDVYELDADGDGIGCDS